MSYTECIEHVEETIQRFCKTYSSEHYKDAHTFGEALLYNHAIQTAYKAAFVEQFGNYITPVIETLLDVSSEHLVFSLSAFLRVTPSASLEQFQHFMETLLTIQIGTFEVWSDGIIVEMVRTTIH